MHSIITINLIFTKYYVFIDLRINYFKFKSIIINMIIFNSKNADQDPSLLLAICFDWDQACFVFKSNLRETFQQTRAQGKHVWLFRPSSVLCIRNSQRHWNRFQKLFHVLASNFYRIQHQHQPTQNPSPPHTVSYFIKYSAKIDS